MILIIGTTEKIDQLASVIAGMNAGWEPGVLGICEAGNRFLVNDSSSASTLVSIQSQSPFSGVGKLVNPHGFSDHLPITIRVTAVD
jgi:hypothetical protein